MFTYLDPDVRRRLIAKGHLVRIDRNGGRLDADDPHGPDETATLDILGPIPLPVHLDDLTLSLTVKSAAAIRSIESAHADLSTTVISDHEARASLERSGARLDEDLVVRVAIENPEPSLEVHVFRPERGDPFFAEIQEVYDEIGEGVDRWIETRPGELRERPDEIEGSGCFDVGAIEQFDWEVVYDADGYIALLDTFSGHIAMERWQRDRLYRAIRAQLADRPSGTLRRHYGAALHIAQRRD